MTDLPISYTNARICVEAAVVTLKTAGPGACRMPPTAYVSHLENLERTARLLSMIEERAAARDAAKGVAS